MAIILGGLDPAQARKRFEVPNGSRFGAGVALLFGDSGVEAVMLPTDTIASIRLLLTQAEAVIVELQADLPRRGSNST